MNSKDIRKLCEENQIRMIDFKMTDIDGRWRHITIPVERFGENIFTQGIGFDGSNYGYAPVEKSDISAGSGYGIYGSFCRSSYTDDVRQCVYHRKRRKYAF